MSDNNVPTIRNLDGIYTRADRNMKRCNLSFSDLTSDEQDQFLSRLEPEGLRRMCKLLAGDLRAIGDKFDIIRVDDEE